MLWKVVWKKKKRPTAKPVACDAIKRSALAAKIYVAMFRITIAVSSYDTRQDSQVRRIAMQLTCNPALIALFILLVVGWSPVAESEVKKAETVRVSMASFGAIYYPHLVAKELGLLCRGLAQGRS
jgi:hypothetical protein